MNYQRVSFKGSIGKKLAARIDLPDHENPVGYAIFAHCFTCNQNLKIVANISRALGAGGIAVLRFDFTGLGDSEGDFGDTTFSSNVDDLIAAADFLTEFHAPPTLLIGHSFGGAAAIHAAGRISSVRAVAVIAAPSDPRHVIRHFGEHQRQIEETGQAVLTLSGRSFTIKKKFIDDLQKIEVENVIGNLKKALLILHSPLDRTVGIEHASRIFQMARHPKSFISLDQADHLLTDSRDSRYAGALIAAWATHYITGTTD